MKKKQRTQSITQEEFEDVIAELTAKSFEMFVGTALSKVAHRFNLDEEEVSKTLQTLNGKDLLKYAQVRGVLASSDTFKSDDMNEAINELLQKLIAKATAQFEALGFQVPTLDG